MSPVRLKPAILAVALMSAASFVGVADAQDAAPPPPPAAAAPLGAPPPAAGAPTTPGPWAQRPQGGMFGRLASLSPAERTALMDARLAAIQAGLELTPDQAKLWPPVEAAIRAGMAQMSDLRQKFAAAGRPGDPMERLSRASELMSAHAASLQKLVAAAQPLYASLDSAQKARIPELMGMAGRMGPGARMRGPGSENRMGPGAWNRQGAGGRDGRDGMRRRMEHMHGQRAEGRGDDNRRDERGRSDDDRSKSHGKSGQTDKSTDD